MRVAVFNGAGNPFTIEHVPDPRPEPGDVVVRVARCGICGSDLTMTSGGPFDTFVGRRMGHEYSGEVVECGPDVTGLEVGDRVACRPGRNCGRCDACLRGVLIECRSGRSFWGGFGDYVAVDHRNAIRMPAGLNAADGALAEPMAAGLHAVRMAGVHGGEHVLALGAGSMALAIVYWARRVGAGRITVLSRSDHRRAIAFAMGADAFHTFDEPELVATETGMGFPDAVFECVGKPGMMERAVMLVRAGGTVASLGMCGEHERFMPAQWSYKELRLVFPLVYTQAEYEETVRELDRGHVHPDIMVSDVIGLEAFPERIDALRAGAQSLKVMIEPSLDARVE